MSKLSRIRTGVKAFIVHDKKILIIKEKIQNGLGTIIYDVPGGGIELGETVHKALVREVKEEVFLDIVIERPVGCWDFVVNGAIENVHLVLLGYQCSVIGSAAVDTTHNPAKEDIFETVWLTKEEILHSEDSMFTEDMKLSLMNVRVE